MEKMIIKEEVQFNASVERVWDLLTLPEFTKQYMFGCELISNWNEGDSVAWKGMTEQGEEMIFVTGVVIENTKYKRLITTTFDPHADMEDIPKNHIPLRYELEANENGTLLTIIQGDFSEAANGKQRYEDSKGGWSSIVIPKMLELIDG